MVAELVSFVGSPQSVLDFPESGSAERDVRSAWDLVEPIVDLLIDWDLLTAEITLDELAEWLGASGSLCETALHQLAALAGVSVTDVDPTCGLVMIRIDADACPLTAAPATVGNR
jgi:hypothetical protein